MELQLIPIDDQHYKKVPLLQASHIGSRDDVLMLLESGTNINLQHPDGSSPLWAASNRGHTAVVSMLLERDADINLQNKDGRSPLWIASSYGKTEVVSLLLELGASIDLQDKEGRSPLLAASYRGHTDVVSKLLESGANINMQDTDGRSPLYAASYNGHKKIVSMLLQRDADIHLQDNEGATSLWIASHNGHAAVVSVLLERGSDINLQDKDGSSPLYAASISGHTEVAFMLIKCSADINLQDNEGASPLWIASHEGFTEVVSMLLDRGADINLQDEDGWSPLHAASSSGHSEVVATLLHRGAYIDLQDKDGASPLWIASNEGFTEVVSRLLDSGADISLLDEDGWSPLHAASSSGHSEVVATLLHRGADIHLQDKDGASPLWIASNEGFTKVVSMLLDRGADINLQDEDGRSPLYAAKSNGHTEVVSLLLDRGADIDLKDNQGCSPLNAAIQNDHTEVKSMLLQLKAASANLPDFDGTLSLQAANQNRPQVKVSLMLKLDADQHNNGALPLSDSISKDRRQEEAVSLVKHGAEINQQDKYEPFDTLESSVNEYPANVLQPTLESHKHTVREENANLEQMCDTKSFEQEEGKDPNIRGQNLKQTCDNGGRRKSKKKRHMRKRRHMRKGRNKRKLLLERQRTIKANTTSRNLVSEENSKIEEKYTNQERVLTRLKISVAPQHPHTDSPPSRQDEPNTSALTNFSKDLNIGEHNLLTTFTAVQQTQTDDDPQKRNVPFSSFCTQWQVTATFTSAGGSLRKPRSDVVLTVPPGAVEKGMYRDVYMAVCTDIPYIHKLLDLPDVYIASPVAEFWSNDDEVFKKPIQIYLPHSLTLPSEQSDVKVYRVTTDPTGKLTLQVLRKDMQTEGAGTKEALIPESQTGTFYFSAEGRICVVTDRFSAYVCIRCGHSNNGTPNIYVIGCGTNKHSSNGFSIGSVKVHVWDQHLLTKDFQPANAVSDAEKLILPLPIDIRSSTIRMKLHCGRSMFEPEWKPIKYDTDFQPDEQEISLESVLHCDGTSCHCSPDHSTVWQLETAQPSPEPPTLRCCVVITYWSNADSLQKTTSSIPKRITMDVNPSPQCPTSLNVNVAGKHVTIGGEQNIVKIIEHESSRQQT